MPFVFEKKERGVRQLSGSELKTGRKRKRFQETSIADSTSGQMSHHLRLLRGEGHDEGEQQKKVGPRSYGYSEKAYVEGGL